MRILSIIKELFLKLGVDVRRYSVEQNQIARLHKIIKDFKVNLVFDIGANTGQFSQELIKKGYGGKIVSFEPLPDAYSELVKASKKYANWFVEERMAIGNTEQEIEINIAANSASSSILKMMDAHISAAPHTVTIGVDKVNVKTLDSISGKYLKDDKKLFVKIDTQGYEYNVLLGALETLKLTKVLQLELSLIELYGGQKLYLEMIEFISSLGFQLWSVDPVFVDVNTGRVLQVDALFLNSSDNI